MKKFLAFIIGLLIFSIIGAFIWGLSEEVVETAKKSKTVVLKPRKKLVVPAGAYLYEIITRNRAQTKALGCVVGSGFDFAIV